MAIRPKPRRILFNIVKIFTSKPVKIAREGLTIDKEPSPTSEGQQEWRRFVGSIRRKVQRHASSSGAAEGGGGGAGAPQPLSRKNSLTQGLFKKGGDVKKQPLTKQKSVGEGKSDLFKSLTFKDKSATVKQEGDSLAAPKPGESPNKGVRKSDKMRDSDKSSLKSSFNLSKNKSSASKSKKEERGLKQDDFLKATMRIFLVVSPPVGKLQVILAKKTIYIPVQNDKLLIRPREFI